MQQTKPLVIALSSLMAITLIVPALLVLPFKDKAPIEKAEVLHEVVSSAPPAPVTNAIEVAVYRTEADAVENVPLEAYVEGVLASEMPAEFELEALKAQALAARTYIVKQMLHHDNMGLPDGANVTDTVLHQVFKNEAELRENWGPDFDWKMDKIRKAVQATTGQIITFNNEPITPAFFSTSNGYTENSEAYWQNPFPYLTSVESPWDKVSPKFSTQKIMTVQEFERKLNIKLPSDGSLGTILGRTPGKRIEAVQIGGKTFTGREIREKLDLRSTDFTWMRTGSEIVITTKGYGHGVGMSQYGANGMAQSGKTYEEIIHYYYKGVNISPLTNFQTALASY
ncbi:stage II sporulation protein D [Bacillus sp. HMF5848]|uniref:stage II sporulation protein D n=1 Tax=Bacillus sp. HMF5848 TaxID=2495421 RepID=UPI000F79F3CA|nr:stage II sporulation protein D [Bacillus sp. HMF5848]RSK28922.1 stage II sporulation protein D [Bacillus sp. HMF5848]